MAVIMKRTGRPKPWYVRYRDPSGKQRTRQFARKVDAKRFLAQTEHEKHTGAWVDPDLANGTNPMP